jgi:hypothetical protein
MNGDFMKKMILGLFLLASSSQAADIFLSSGQSIILGNTTVSCMAGPQPTGMSSCAIARSMAKEDLYMRARTIGVGGCYIFNNGDYYGVIDYTGKQISMTYDCSGSYGGYCEAPVKGLIQLACDLRKCRN